MIKHWMSAALLAAGLMGCASPPARFYGLDAPALSPAAVQFGKRVMVGPVSLPAALDRPQLVLDDGNGELRLQEYARWSAPLDRLLAQNLAAGVSRAGGVASVYAYPQPGMDGGDLRYTLDVRRLSLRPGRGVGMDAVWQLLRTADGAVLASGAFSRDSAVSRPDAAALLTACQGMLAELAAEMALPLRQHPQWWQRDAAQPAAQK
ncbi:PqiC family protein [Chromobacterium paludis]|uniref:Membrane integrity-associated transporter subunit PqiC n=1 Tax=Chromobacterium paludis TaxID=2605945 RepID=A0A5C1DFF1_9NEIS|nr:PqiC family protein [Chromobacterium paludis]QEL55253.1 membrane integrity-associated transporter subunit PqiC [Chromobacterium paludis]